MYLRFSKILPVCGCHIGYPVTNWSEIFTSACTTNIFMERHGSIPVISWQQNNINKFGLGVIYPASIRTIRTTWIRLLASLLACYSFCVSYVC
jgi:hypothetical protein